MDIHRDVSDIVNDVVLRDVIQIHGMDCDDRYRASQARV